MGVNPLEELSFIRQYTVNTPKNYQLWRNREAMVSLVLNKPSSAEETRLIKEGELRDLDMVFEDEPKNYHAWQYRLWLVGHLSLDPQGEVDFTKRLLSNDPFNNSAWNHRYVLFERNPKLLQLAAEVLFIGTVTQDYRKVPNPSILNYLHGIFSLLQVASPERHCILETLGINDAYTLIFIIKEAS